jgi:hypothetical protein
MASKREEERQRKRNRVQLDIDPDVDREMAEWAAELGISRSQLYELGALDILDGLNDDDLVEKITRLREAQSHIKFPFTLAAFLAARRAKYKKKK